MKKNTIETYKTYFLKGIFTMLILLFSTSVFAQPGWEWCEPVEETKAKYTLLSNGIKTGDYDIAKTYLDDLLETCPKVHVSLYMNGVKVYKGLLRFTEDDVLKEQYQEKVLKLYDKRIEYYGSESKVLNRKAVDAYKYLKKKKDRCSELLNLFDRTFELNGNAVYIQNLAEYMDVVRRYQTINRDLSKEEIIKRYQTINDIIEYQIEITKKSRSKQSRYKKIKDINYKILLLLSN